MRLKRLIDGMARTRSGLMVLSGLTAVLSGVEKVMIVSLQTRTPGAGVKVQPALPVQARRQRTDYFAIRRTCSELGYVYWVLQGYGYFQSFTLFDTWAEAMQQADEKLRHARALTREEDFSSTNWQLAKVEN
jgi:hypothetical protein